MITAPAASSALSAIALYDSRPAFVNIDFKPVVMLFTSPLLASPFNFLPLEAATAPTISVAAAATRPTLAPVLMPSFFS